MKPIRQLSVVPTLPENLEPLRELALNLWWTWDNEALSLFRHLDSELWEETYHNPVAMLGKISQEQLQVAAKNEVFLAHLDVIQKKFKSYLSAPSWFENYSNNKPLAKIQIAYFSMEFGLTECMPLYSGGLGVLAGDHLKSTSYLGLPFVGVGLLYQHGYFRQTLTSDGWQMADYPTNDFYNMPIQPAQKTDGTQLLVEVDYPEGKAFAKVWRAQVGRVPLYLLDTNIPENENIGLRDITDYLYGGDERMRIKQEILLGIGGYRALAALGIRPTVCHMNEGHAAFLALERIRQLMVESGIGFDEAREATTAGNIFTTHTPVPAGIDWFPPDLVKHYFRNYFGTLGISEEKFLGLGRKNPSDNSSEFSPALVALRFSTMSNCVSQLHGHVSRNMWKELWQNLPVHEVPIKAITNGIHTRSWVSEDMQSLFDRYLGPKWIVDLTNQDVWTQISQIPDTELWRTHERRRERLIAFARQRQSQKRRKSADQTLMAQETDQEHETGPKILNSAALTIGFARRFATYKRATLLFNDLDRLAKILNDPERPVQLIFAGKAHPHDHEGKVLIQKIHKIATELRFQHKILFIENYDICVGRYLVEGVDVWLNTPLPPNEASGTSGMKAAANGALNLSMADGWWAEAQHLGGGWTIDATPEADDTKSVNKAHANAIYDLLENEVVPLFYDRDPVDDIPYGWVTRMKTAMQNLAPVFNTKRMVAEYAERLYFPAHQRWLKLNQDGTRRSIALANWKANIRKHWSNLRIEEQISKAQSDIPQKSVSALTVGESVTIQAVVRTDALFPNELAVQIYHGVLDSTGEIQNGSVTEMEYQEDLGSGKYLFEGTLSLNQTGLHGYTLRVLPSHEDLESVYELGLITWA
ncbi:alpha-glucan family phosphorylase [Candidatus Poribacteria bacterium]|nr:alpha-glucan family phosphorylase [Candidatus Poribacteria bacterium]